MFQIKVCISNNGNEKAITLNHGNEYTYDDGEKLVAVPLKQFKALFILYKINIATTSPSQTVEDINQALLKCVSFFD